MTNRSSDTIRIARVICILCVIYPHFPPYDNLAVDFSIFELITWEMSWVIGRSSVAVLSIISGFLLVHSLAKRDFPGTVKEKLSTLIVPLVAWNVVAVLVAMIQGGLTVPQVLNEWPNLFFGLTAAPKMVPLYFLRDIFVCVLLYPLLSWSLQKSAALTLFVLFVNASFNLDNAVLINSSILMFFGFGCVLAKRKRTLIPPWYGRSWVAISVTFLLVTLANYPLINRLLVDPWPTEGSVPETLYVLHRICGAYLFWSLAVLVASGTTSLKQLIMRCETVIFLVFCIHPLLISILWKGAQLMLGAEVGNPVHLLVFAVSPLIVLASCIVIASAGSRISPGLLSFVLGRRLQRENSTEDRPFLGAGAP